MAASARSAGSSRPAPGGSHGFESCSHLPGLGASAQDAGPTQTPARATRGAGLGGGWPPGGGAAGTRLRTHPIGRPSPLSNPSGTEKYSYSSWVHPSGHEVTFARRLLNTTEAPLTPRLGG